MLTSSGIIVAVAVFAAQESLNDIIGGMMFFLYRNKVPDDNILYMGNFRAYLV